MSIGLSIDPTQATGMLSSDCPAGEATLRVKALMSMPCPAHGVGMTCRSILRALAADRHDTVLFTSRSDSVGDETFQVRTFTPPALRRLPFRLTRPISFRQLHRTYLSEMRDGDMAYLWPSAPPAVYEALHRRGHFIVTEAINTRIRHARAVLDAAYDAVGLPATHGLTDQRIATEEHRLALCDAIFSPSPATDASLAAGFVDGRPLPFLPTSYGTDYAPPPRARSAQETRTALFIGTSPIRKGLHHILEAWRDMPKEFRLRIIGLSDAAFIQRYADVLALPNVSFAGFSADVQQEYGAADLFLLPSLEEGDPIVTYEAAAYGLPVLASPAGAGRIGAETGAIVTFDTADIETLRDRIVAFLRSDDLSRAWGERAQVAVRNYRWQQVVRRRAGMLAARLAARG